MRRTKPLKKTKLNKKKSRVSAKGKVARKKPARGKKTAKKSASAKKTRAANKAAPAKKKVTRGRKTAKKRTPTTKATSPKRKPARKKKTVKKATPARKTGAKVKTKRQARRSRAKQTKTKKTQAEGIKGLWQEYKKSGSEVLRDKIVLHYSPLVKYVAGRIASKLPPNVEAADLISYGMFGLIDAIEKFDLRRGVKFETYAITRIRGAIIDELRKIDWVPRLIRFRAKRFEEAYLNLLNKYKRSPTDKELAQELGFSVAELQDLMAQMSRASQLTLEELWGKEGEGGEKVGLIDLLGDAETKDPSAVLEFEEIKKVIGDAISELPQREKIIIALYYYRDLSLREIAEILDLTESRVSQLHIKALFHLKMRLRRNKPLLLAK